MSSEEYTASLERAIVLLRKAARDAVHDYENFMDDPDETYPEYHHKAIRRLRKALDESDIVY